MSFSFFSHGLDSFFGHIGWSEMEMVRDGRTPCCSVSFSKGHMGEFADSLYRFCMPPMIVNPSSLMIIMDTYGKKRIKAMTQKRKGHSGRKVLINEKGQAMPKGKDWNTFLQSGDNKTADQISC